MPPEIDPKELQEIDPVPSLTMEEAKDAIRRAIKAELAWDRCYDDDSAEKCTGSYTSRFSRCLLRLIQGSDHEFNRLKVKGVRQGFHGECDICMKKSRSEYGSFPSLLKIDT